MKALQKEVFEVQDYYGEIARITGTLPPLPSTIRYYDDYNASWYPITDIASKHEVIVNTDGKIYKIDFSAFGALQTVMKHVFVDMCHRLDPTTNVLNFAQFTRYCKRGGLGRLCLLTVSSPHVAKVHWQTDIASSEPITTTNALRTMLHSFCRTSIGDWRPSHEHFLKTFGGPRPDKLKVVREGQCFIESAHLQKIVDELDRVSAAVIADPDSITNNALLDASLMSIVIVRGTRPGQLALMEIDDVIIYPDSVHLVIRFIKQRYKTVRMTAQIRARHEWSPILVEFQKRRRNLTVNTDSPARLLFGVTPREIGKRIIGFAETATGTHRTATDFRHTAAQRQADAGMTRRDLRDFLFHRSDKSAEVYYTGSASQAQRINEAMAISPVYSKLRKVAKTKTIEPGDLWKKPTDHQVGGMPVGIPLAGIGACGIGQSLCARNPVLACYTCPKFLPVSDIAIHLAVLEAFRTIVREFIEAAMGDEQHPAYAQLQTGLESVRWIIEDLRRAERRK